MRILVRALDTVLRWVYGVFEFCDDEACLLRLRVTRAPHAIPLPDGEVPAGAPVLEPHLWNEHMPPIPQEGADVAWAVRTYRMLVDSLPAVAYQIRHDPKDDMHTTYLYNYIQLFFSSNMSQYSLD